MADAGSGGESLKPFVADLAQRISPRAGCGEAGILLPFSQMREAADLERISRDLLRALALAAGVRILPCDGEVGLATERRFRLGWWTTADEALRAALHRAKTRVYQHAEATGAWQTLTRAWEAAEREVRSAPWRRHLRVLGWGLPPSERTYLRLAFRAAQQAASRDARWRSVLVDVPSPFTPLVELFARGAWPVGCRDGELWILVWSPQAHGCPEADSSCVPSVALDLDPVVAERRLFLSAPFRERALSAVWQTALEDRGWRVVHGPVGEETRAPEVQLARQIREANAVLGLLGDLDPDFGLPWWMFQELDYACTFGRPVVLVGRGHSADPELGGIHRIDAPLAEPAAVLERHPVLAWFQGSLAPMAGALLAIWIVIACAPPRAAAQPASAGAAGASSGASAAALPDPERMKLERDRLTAERDKLQAERKKLDQEAQQLRDTHETIGKLTRLTTTWAAAIGSLFGALVTLAVGLVGFFLNQTQRDKLKQDKELEQKKHELEIRKLEQERAQERVKHLLDIFRDLGSDQPRIRMGAVSILVQKIQKIRSGMPIDPDDKEDLPTIVSTLIIATKDEGKPEIQKQVADGLAQALAAVVPEHQKAPSTPESPLKPYDFQGARLENAWWKRVDARGVDFYKAHLVRAGLRQAFLSQAVLKKADLRNATLVEAQLDGADLTDADLRGANLRGANVAGAKFQGARLDSAILDGVDLSLAMGVDPKHLPPPGAPHTP